MSQNIEKPRLTYFSSRGKAEIIRLVLHAANVDFEDIGVGIWHPINKTQEFKDLVSSNQLTFDALPLFQNKEISLVQSSSILRYVSKKYGLMGTTIEEEALIDQFMEGISDIYDCLKSPFVISYPVANNINNTDNSGMTEVNDSLIEGKIEKVLKERLPKIFGQFERALQGKTYLANEKLSVADIWLFYIIDNLIEVLGDDVKQVVLKEFVNVLNLHERVGQVEGIKKHINNPNRYPKQTFMAVGYDKVLKKLVGQ
ncbi:hypothetical protein ABK040_001305 [Willaertia magna]